MAHLTETERQTLNDAHAILMGRLDEGDYWGLGWRHTKGCGTSWDVTMFTPLRKIQHSYVEGKTFADKIETGLAIIAAERSEYSEEKAKAYRIEALRKQLADLTGEPA